MTFPLPFDGVAAFVTGLISTFLALGLSLRHRGAFMWSAFAACWLADRYLFGVITADTGHERTLGITIVAAALQGLGLLALVEATGAHARPPDGWRRARRAMLVQAILLTVVAAASVGVLSAPLGFEVALLFVRTAALPAFGVAFWMTVRAPATRDAIAGRALALALGVGFARSALNVAVAVVSLTGPIGWRDVVTLQGPMLTLHVVGSLLLAGSALYLTLAEKQAEARAVYASQYQFERLATLGRMADRVNEGLRATFEDLGEAIGASAGATPDVRDSARVVSIVRAARDRVSAMLLYARDYVPRIERFRLDEWLVHQSGVGHAKSHREVQLVLNAGSAEVLADRLLVRRMIDALAQNGWEAQAGGGVLHIRTGTSPDGGHVWISVRDHGDGIPAAVVNLLGEPFVTTKDSAEHAGLGLAITKVYADLCKAELQFASASGGGTVASIVLPTVG